MRREIRLSGSGGQGLILAGIILAESAVNHGLNAVQSQSYGPEARGGASKAEVIISDEPINFSKVTRADILLALSQNAYDKYIKESDADTIIMIDSSIDPKGTYKHLYQIPIIDTAVHEIGKAMVANIVALGALSCIIPEVNRNEVLSAILARVPKGTEELNSKAFAQGERLVDVK